MNAARAHIFLRPIDRKTNATRSFGREFGREPVLAGLGLGSLTDPWMDEIHFAPPEKPWNDDSPVNANEQWLPIVL